MSWSKGTPFVLATLFVASACGSDPAQDDSTGGDSGPDAPQFEPIESGERLRAQWVSDSTGDVRYLSDAGWFDLELGVDCDWTRLEDEYRCLPPLATIVFRDSGCTQPAVLVDGCSQAEFANPRQFDVDCSGELQADAAPIYEVGRIVESTVESYWILDLQGPVGADCVEVSPQSEHVQLAAVGPEVPLDAFVAGELRREDTGSRLAVDVIVGEDGSREQVATYDSILDSKCGYDPFWGGGRCVPQTNVGIWAPHYAGSECTGDRVGVSSAEGSCEATRFVSERVVDDACQTTTRYYERGEQWTGPVAKEGQGGACTPVATGDGTFYEVGTEISSSLATFTLTTRGEGRLRLTVPTYEDVVEVPAKTQPWLADSSLDIDCVAKPTPDGKSRCLPVNMPNIAPPEQSQYWADPTCSEAPLFTWLPSDCSPTPDWLAVREGSGCGAGQQVWPRSAAWTGVVHMRTPDGCVPTTLPQSWIPYVIGEQVPSSEFAELETFVE